MICIACAKCALRWAVKRKKGFKMTNKSKNVKPFPPIRYEEECRISPHQAKMLNSNWEKMFIALKTQEELIEKMADALACAVHLGEVSSMVSDNSETDTAFIKVEKALSAYERWVKEND